MELKIFFNEIIYLIRKSKMQTKLEIEEPSLSAEKKIRRLFLASVTIALVVLLIAGAIGLMVLSTLDEQNIQRKEFELSTSAFVLGLENFFDQWNRRLIQLRAVAELTYIVPQDEFRSRFEKPLSLRQWEIYLKGLVGSNYDEANVLLGWTAKVELQHRAEFERFIRKAYDNEKAIMIEVSEKGVAQEAAVRPFYFPYAFLWPWQKDRNRTLDLASEVRRKKILELAFEMDAPNLSEPITFLIESRGIYLVAPAFDLSMFPAMDVRNVSHACPKSSVDPLLCDALLGFVTLLFNVQSAVQEAAELFLLNTYVKVIDMDTNEVLTECHPCEHSQTQLRVDRVLSLNNRQWKIEMHLCDKEQQAYSRYKWFIMAGAVIMSVVIAFSIFILEKKTEKFVTAQRGRRIAEAERENEERNRLLAEEERVEADAARVRAEEMSKAKARFLNNMNRELRTPLSGVVGTIDILQNTLPKEVLEEYAEDFRTISNCAEVLLSTVNDILDINKLMAGKLMLHYTYFYIRDVVESCISTVRAAATKKRIEMIMKMPKTLQVVLSDQARLSQIVLNFLSNAVKFTPEDGKITITLTWEKIEQLSLKRVQTRSGDIGMREDDLRRLQETCQTQKTEVLDKHGVESHQKQVTLCVEDSGIGIAEDKIARLFQPFEQADASVTRAYGGTGLGLSICRQLAQLLGGSVWVESTLGVGSKFYLNLPMDVVREEHIDTLISSDEGLARSRAKHVEVVARLSDNSLEQNGGKRHSLSDIYEVQMLPQTVLAEGEGESLSVEKERVSQEEEQVEKAIVLDIVSNNNGDHKRPRRSEKVKKGLVRQFSGKKVLIVEDSLLNQRVFTKYLKNVGVEVTVANNGQLGVEEAKKMKFDLILMDCHMPVMDGYLATQYITTDEECVNNSTPIIALTADVESSNKQKCEESGMVDFLTKPLQSATLYNAMGKFLHGVAE